MVAVGIQPQRTEKRASAVTGLEFATQHPPMALARKFEPPKYSSHATSGKIQAPTVMPPSAATGMFPRTTSRQQPPSSATPRPDLILQRKRPRRRLRRRDLTRRSTNFSRTTIPAQKGAKSTARHGSAYVHAQTRVFQAQIGKQCLTVHVQTGKHCVMDHAQRPKELWRAQALNAKQPSAVGHAIAPKAQPVARPLMLV